MPLDASWAIEWTRRTAASVTEHRDELTELDRAIGDGDHGVNLERGFRAAVDKLDSGAADGTLPTTPAGVLKAVATTLIATIGGAAGPLVGTAFLRASRVGDAAELSSEDVARLVRGASDGVEARGRAESGDKTMIDAWHPAAAAAEAAAAAGDAPLDVLRQAAEAATEGARGTESLLARKGRASYLGARSVGHRDPGAESAALILRAAVEAAESHESAGD